MGFDVSLVNSFDAITLTLQYGFNLLNYVAGNQTGRSLVTP